MGQKRGGLGRNTLEVLEDVPAALAARFINQVLNAVRDEQPASTIGAVATSEPDARIAPDLLSDLDAELLAELETQSQRVAELADGKGAQSLKTIVDEVASHEEGLNFEQQLDEICRSCWAYLELQNAFQNAESFHQARKDREQGKVYSAFGLDLEDSIPAEAATVDVRALTSKLDEILGLGKAPAISLIDLPETETHSASLMLIVRHGSDLASVYEHRADGSRHPHYFRPQDEIVLIYTARDRRIEVLGRSFGQRHDVSSGFAEHVLGHDISAKPLSEKIYDLGRFATSFELNCPDIDGVDIQSVVVTECELLLGGYGRRASLKVTREDDIDEMLKRYLSGAYRFRGPRGINRVTISVRYCRQGERLDRSLNITLRGSNGSNVQSHKDRETRELGASLLNAWGITRSLRPLDQDEAADMMPSLLRLFDLGETVVTGLRLEELGLTVDALLDARLISQKKRQNQTLLDEEDGNVTEEDVPFIASRPTHTASDYTEYSVAGEWLRETIAKNLGGGLATKTFRQISEDLVRVGDIETANGTAPVYLARGLHQPKVIFKLEEELRSRESTGDGIVLCAGPEAPRFLVNNVAVQVSDVWLPDGGATGLSVDRLLDRFNSERRLIAQNTRAQVVRTGAHSGSFIMPRKEPLPLLGNIQINFFEALANAYNSGAPEVHTSVLTEDNGAGSPKEVFSGKMRTRVFPKYVVKGSLRGLWRLAD